MAEIGFYHLMRTSADQALLGLLGRTLNAGHRAVVRLGSAARVAELDAALWASTDPDWLPHGTPESGDADLAPIWLTALDDAPNGARFVFLLDGTRTGRLAEALRVFDLFDGRDDASVAAARRRWSEAKAAGHGVTYWQQGARGWEKRG